MKEYTYVKNQNEYSTFKLRQCRFVITGATGGTTLAPKF